MLRTLHLVLLPHTASCSTRRYRVEAADLKDLVQRAGFKFMTALEVEMEEARHKRADHKSKHHNDRPPRTHYRDSKHQPPGGHTPPHHEIQNMANPRHRSSSNIHAGNSTDFSPTNVSTGAAHVRQPRPLPNTNVPSPSPIHRALQTLSKGVDSARRLRPRHSRHSQPDNHRTHMAPTVAFLKTQEPELWTLIEAMATRYGYGFESDNSTDCLLL